MSKKALFPGSFDPFTLGHQSLVERALKLFDHIVIGIGVNSSKNYLFDVEKRKTYIEGVFSNHAEQIEVVDYEGLTVDYCKNHSCQFIIRGVRNTKDFLFENEIANMNRSLNHNIETVFLASNPEHAFINSSIVREIYRSGGDVSSFIPKNTTLPLLEK